MNLSKQKRQKMLEFLENLKAKNQDEESIETLTEIENELNGKKYGLVWEEHEENVDALMKENFPVFTEVQKNKIVSDKELPYNFLLEGDNLQSLRLLQKTHEGKIDIIYIDPPYNTGNKDFKYNDSFVEKEDAFRHSKWLSFMQKRLEIAKTLLKENGVIFISIDDNEQANLKLLCDDVFGEENFVANNVIETANGVFGKRAKAIFDTFVKTKDYMLVYLKNKDVLLHNFIPLYMPTDTPFDEHFSTLIDENLTTTNLIDFFKTDKYCKEKFEKYNMQISLKNVSHLMSIDDDFNKFIINEMSDRIYQSIDFSSTIPNEIEKKLQDGEIFKYKDYLLYKTRDGIGEVRFYSSFRNTLRVTDSYNSRYCRAVAIGDLWKGFGEDMKNVNKEGDCQFSNGKKPVRLIKQCCKWANNPSATVLDFFAGSGTTAQAVLELNKEDGGNRKFILCTNNENDICQSVTFPRIKTVITGKRSDGTKYSDGIPSNLKYFKCDWLSFGDAEVSVLYKHVKELIELENAVDIDEKTCLMVLTENDLASVIKNWASLKKSVKSIYYARNIMWKNDWKKTLKGVNLFVIPEYYFETELKETGEDW